MTSGEPTLYEMVGGEPTFQQLVEVFYTLVEADAVLRPLFPADLEPGKRWQQLFLMQYFGGPAVYMAERGHPRLRMRHNPFPIGHEARDRWLAHMLTAVDQVGIAEPMRSTMREYFEFASRAMINVDIPLNRDNS